MIKLKHGLTTFDIKVIGILLMVVDHFHQMFFTIAPTWFDYFGRPVATIFFFVSVIGFSHTHSKEKYRNRLYLGMILMAIGDLLLTRFVPTQVQLINNIFIDLFLGVVLMYGVDAIGNYRRTNNWHQLLLGIFLWALPVLLAIPSFLVSSLSGTAQQVGVTAVLTFVPSVLTAENNLMVYLIPFLYIFRNNKNIQAALIALVSLIYLLMGNYQWLMVFAVVPLYLYNGEKGSGMRNFFYYFYPLHIWILYLIAALFGI
ncbi:TraX family protein [uncultured Fructobacillus sp.]|uniref:TraX family protein n=1 Tax=uncultured Fructobacillus sp. TaxID=591942 RepID=UPI00259A33E2|nr:TraX family protein [uncultured Fructobacillus sp.]